MKIGSYQVHTLETGEFALDGGAMFGVVPKTLWGNRMPVDEKNRIEMRLRCLLVCGEGRNILVDCGMGNKWDAKLAEIYRLDTRRFSLEGSLAAHGLKPHDITDVLLTHLHFDHAGGSTRRKPDGKVVPTFERARYHIQRENLSWATQPTEKDRASYLKQDWEPLIQAGVLEILDGPREIFPGIQVRLFFGHTQGIQLPLISDGKTALFFCGDVIPTSLHLAIPWVMAYDNFPLVTIKEKKEILARAARENWILVFEHCPLVPAARITATEKGYQLAEPISF